MLALAAPLIVGSAVVGLAAPAQAADAYCSDANTTRPNDVDNCFVRHSDRNQNYVAEVSMKETDCSQLGFPLASIRVRIIGDYVAAGDKVQIRTLAIRYLSGTRPFAYFQIDVDDGNHHSVNRPWNWNGDWVRNDSAAKNTNNVMTLNPPPGYAPTFGANHVITFHISMVESLANGFPDAGACHVGSMYVRMLPSVFP
jgi:hypothetical protein